MYSTRHDHKLACNPQLLPSQGKLTAHYHQFWGKTSHTTHPIPLVRGGSNYLTCQQKNHGADQPLVGFKPTQILLLYHGAIKQCVCVCVCVNAVNLHLVKRHPVYQRSPAYWNASCGQRKGLLPEHA